MKEQQEKYSDFKKEKISLNKPLPMGDGALVFDEVKVIEKVIWNSKSHKFMGFAMDKDEFKNLQDVFQNPTEPQPTKYVLQFLWRDLTSGFDMIGPYFSFGSAPGADDLVSCVLQTILALQGNGFGVLCIVCDGASSNLSAIKKLMRFKGTFECEPGDYRKRFQIDPKFENPFKPGRDIYFVICPTHEMKSMISALHSSRQGGTKSFHRNQVFFGWEEIKLVKK